jgi:hypothetical protein
MKKGNKKAQLHLSFGVIFSIVLIIIFLAFGFYAITKFIELQRSIQIESFLRNLQDDIDAMWKSNQGSQNKTYTLPAKINAICFTDDEDELWNLIFESEQIIPGRNIANIALDDILAEENPYCIPNLDGKIRLRLFKDFGETSVKIERRT